MNNVIKILLSGIGIVATVALLAVLSGTILYWIWPVAVPMAFPKLVEEGWIAGQLDWWVSVCLVWVFGILIKATQTNNNK